MVSKINEIHQNDINVGEESFIINGKYLILKKIWSGSFGIVYLGKDLSISRYVAIKELHPRLLKEPKFIEMFIEEANILANLNHPNIVNILELVMSGDHKRFFIIMEYIQGVNLYKVISQCHQSKMKIPTEIAAYIISETAKALEQCHRSDVIHRDLNPNNIMISVEGHIKLIDFGVAKSSLKRIKNDDEGFMIGKVAYMAPEQLLGKKDVSQYSDVYSLGVMLYETLDGAPLFNAKEKEALKKLINESSIDRIIFEKDEKIIPVELKQVIIIATQKDVSKRNISAIDFHDRIEDFLHQRKSKYLTNRCKKFIHELFSSSDLLSLPNETIQNIDTNEIENIQASFPSDLSQVTPTPSPSPIISEIIPTTHDISNIATATQEDEQVTVWERVVIAGRKHIRILKAVLTIIPICLFLWGILDVFFQFTNFGQGVYDIVNPPSLIMNTIPEDAIVKIDGVTLKKRTPVSIPKLSAGLHEIICELEGFENINEIIDIPSGKVRKKPIEYIKPFSRQIIIESNPVGAAILLNDIILSKKTPFSIIKEVNENIKLALSYDGFTIIEDFELNLQNGRSTIKDRRIWNFNTRTDSQGVTAFMINGHFFKNVQLQSNPSGALVYIDGENASAGKSPKTFNLTAGDHQIEMRPPKEYENFNSANFLLNINRRTPSKILRQLRKKIVIRAEDFDGNTISANLIFLNPGPSGKQYEPIDKATPFHSTLGCFDSQMQLRHKNFYDTSAVLPKEISEITVKMRKKEPRNPAPIHAPIQVEVTVTDEDDQNNLEGVKVSVRKAQSEDFFIELGITDQNGVMKTEINSGSYDFIFQKGGYDDNEIRKRNVSEDLDSEMEFCKLALKMRKKKDKLVPKPDSTKVIASDTLKGNGGKTVIPDDQRKDVIQVEIAVIEEEEWTNLEGVRVSVRKAQSEDPFIELGITDQNGVIKTKINSGSYDFLFKKEEFEDTVIRNHKVSEKLGSEIVCNLTKK
ncbi:serine/threonine protein kinase [candidate division KSB1 bacterium]|nr:serine/threonine protein kinase [candidate division KSB1 bacterium]